jgi:hypothetical protein
MAGDMSGEYMLYGQLVASGAVDPCGVMVLRALLAAANDPTFSLLVREPGGSHLVAEALPVLTA